MVGRYVGEIIRAYGSDRCPVYPHTFNTVAGVWSNGKTLVCSVFDRKRSLRRDGSVCSRVCRDVIGFEGKGVSDRCVGIHGYGAR